MAVLQQWHLNAEPMTSQAPLKAQATIQALFKKGSGYVQYHQRQSQCDMHQAGNTWPMYI